MSVRRESIGQGSGSATDAMLGPLLSNAAREFLADPNHAEQYLSRERQRVEKLARLEVAQAPYFLRPWLTNGLPFAFAIANTAFVVVYYTTKHLFSSLAISLALAMLVLTYLTFRGRVSARRSQLGEHVILYAGHVLSDADKRHDHEVGASERELTRWRTGSSMMRSASSQKSIKTHVDSGTRVEICVAGSESYELPVAGFYLSNKLVVTSSSALPSPNTGEEYVVRADGSSEWMPAKLIYAGGSAGLALLRLADEDGEVSTSVNSSIPGILSTLGTALQSRSIRSGTMDDLDRATELLEQAVESSSEDDPDLPARLSNLGAALQSRYGRLGAVEDLDRAIGLFERAAEGTAEVRPNRAALSNLGVALQSRYGRLGAVEDLDRAIGLLEQVVDSSSEDDPDLPARLSNLGAALQSRYGRLGAVEDLDRAIGLFERAAEGIAEGRPSRAAILSNLGVALQSRYGRLGAVEDLDRAIELLERAVELSPFDDPDRVAMLSNLGVSLQLRYVHSTAAEDLDRAIGTLEQAVSWCAPSHPDRPVMVANLNAIRETTRG